MKKLLPFAALLAILPAAAWSKAPPPRNCGELPTAYDGVAFAGDGDTINGVRYPSIRLWGSNAPELRNHDRAEMVPGMQARALTADRLAEAGNKVHCEPIEWDRYCRVVASCTAGGKDLTMELLKAGLSYGYYLAKHPDRVDQALAYSNAEQEARKGRVGLWPYWLGEKPPVEQSTARP